MFSSDLKPDEKFMYDTSELTEENMWLKDILLSDRYCQLTLWYVMWHILWHVMLHVVWHVMLHVMCSELFQSYLFHFQ